MKHSLLLSGVVGAVVALSACAWAQPVQLPEPLVTQDFEGELPTWLGLGDNSKVSTEHRPENVKVGAGSLRFDYNIAQGQVNILMSPLAPRSLDTLESISFWVKADHNASLIFALQEQGGGRFGAAFSVIANQWQRVEISPSELVLQTGKDDPKDENGKLDREKIEGAALLDLDLLFAQLAAANNPLAKMLGVQMGARTLYLDGLTFSSKPLSPEAADPAIIDDFKHPQAAWMKVGDVTLRTDLDEETKTTSLQADYSQATAHISAFAKLLPIGVLTGKKQISFELASRRRATLVVQLEETSGGKYNTVLEVPGDTTPSTHTLSFADFKAADDSRDDNDRLNVEQVKQLLIIDGSALLGQGEGENTLWLSHVRVK